MRQPCKHRKLRFSQLTAGLLLCHAAQAAQDPEAPAAVASDTAASIPRAASHADLSARLPGATPQGGNTIVVQNCNDAGTGSLRAAVGAAQSGDTIDLTQLACTKITLTTGEITVIAESLAMDGPGPDALSIDGGLASSHFNRVFNHLGLGTLALNHVTITNARNLSATFPAGGCIRSQGTVVLNDSVVSNCFVQTQQDMYVAKGGGIFASGVTLVHSKVSGNFAGSSSGTGDAEGGGIYSQGSLTAKYSTISDNFVYAGSQMTGGGAFVNLGNLYLNHSTVSGNYSGGQAGGIYMTDYFGTYTARVINSTISGNRSVQDVAGFTTQATTTIANSTIAFNASDPGFYAGGLRFKPSHGTTLTLQSSIIANNSMGGADADISVDAGASVSGANNLIVRHSGPIPSGTISSCPLIGPLGDQGGETHTHRLLLGSPAIDAGDNTTVNAAFDQRGSGYPRTHGANTDIGAFEDQGVTPNVIFMAGFEGRCR